jgi:hypothetical protein
MRQTILLLFSLLFAGSNFAQPDFDNIIYDNEVYVDYISSVQFYINGFPLDDPIVSIEDENPLALFFDDFNENVADYYYTIIHCDMDWERSNLNSMEFIDGFVEERIIDYRFSQQTMIPYTSYSLTIPNRNMSFTKTGNYLLVVYKKDRDPIPVLTRRFVVYEPKLLIDGRLVRPNQVSKLRTHQELDFTVFRDPKFRLANPKQEIRATILQNGRWDTAVEGLVPFFVKNQELVFDYQDKIVFPGAKEFRFIDIRSLRFRNFNIAEIIRRVDGHDVILATDAERSSNPYVQIADANGKFTIENQDRGDPFLSADYAEVFFTYSIKQPFTDKDVYLLGAFNDWQIEEIYRMVYNERINAYVLKVPLKQGYYNYQYAYVSRTDAKSEPDISESEGNWHNTENDYTVLIYYRPFGGRYDQVIGHLKINSMD